MPISESYLLKKNCAGSGLRALTRDSGACARRTRSAGGEGCDAGEATAPDRLARDQDGPVLNRLSHQTLVGVKRGSKRVDGSPSAV